MTWLDLVLIGVFIFFVVVGARLGSLWTGACLIGGFFGAALMDTYTLPLAGLMGDFNGATVVAALCLYVGGLGAILIPGAVISKIGSAFILNVIDGAFGLLTGAFAAMLLISLFLLSAGPLFPKFESSPAFRKSGIARPLHRTLEEVFAQTPFKSLLAHKRIKKEAAEQIQKLKP